MIEVYCDESRPELLYGNKNRDTFMIIGGIWIPYIDRANLKEEIKKLRVKHDVYGEIKWKNVSPSKLGFYFDLIDLFFEFSSARFRCIVVDSTLVDLEKYHGADSELGFYKFYYQLLKHWINYREKYWIYLDYKKNKLSDRLHTLEEVLQNSTSGTIADVQAINSKESLMIQLADVLIGAVGYRYNGYKSSNAKLTVVRNVEAYLGHRIKKTYRTAEKFNVFEIDLT